MASEIPPSHAEQIADALVVVIQSWDRCNVCGAENNDEHDSEPHTFTPPDITALFIEELEGIGLAIITAKEKAHAAALADRLTRLEHDLEFTRNGVMELVNCRKMRAPGCDCLVGGELALRKLDDLLSEFKLALPQDGEARP